MTTGFCVCCGDEYSVADGFEATDYCYLCSQDLTPKLLTALKDVMNFIATDGLVNYMKQARMVIREAERNKP